MNEHPLTLKNIRYWYYRYKDTNYYSLSLIIVTLIVCFYLLFNILVPLIQSEFSIRNQVISTRQDIETINQNINFITTLDKNQLSNQLQTATLAMPDGKSFGDLSNAVTYAAEAAGVALEDYSFQVGVVSDPTDRGLQQTNLTLVVDGNIAGVQKFIQSLYQTLPLASIIDVEGNATSANIDVAFYSKAFSTINVSNTEPLTPITFSQATLLQKLSLWQMHGVVPPSVNASESSVPLF